MRPGTYFLDALIPFARDALERNADELARRLLLFTGAVVVGLWLEYVPEFLEKAARWGAKRGFKDRFSDGNVWYPKWMKRLEVIGAILILGGVSGELYTELYHGALEAKIRDLSNSAIAESNERAAEANKEAGEAKRETASITKENLVLQADVLRLQERLSDRVFTADQQSRFAAALAGKIRFRVRFESSIGDEPVRYARQIIAAFVGWDVNSERLGVMVGNLDAQTDAAIKTGGLLA